MRIAVSRQPAAEREVAPLELFFDLVYVFAIAGIAAAGAVLVAVAVSDTITEDTAARCRFRWCCWDAAVSARRSMS